MVFSREHVFHLFTLRSLNKPTTLGGGKELRCYLRLRFYRVNIDHKETTQELMLAHVAPY